MYIYRGMVNWLSVNLLSPVHKNAWRPNNQRFTFTMFEHLVGGLALG
jgi:hypothetical protein